MKRPSNYHYKELILLMTKLTTCLIGIIAIFTIGTSITGQAQTPVEETPSNAQSTTGPTPPPGVEAPKKSSLSAAAVTLMDVPAYLWRHGCGPTAAGMVIGYWDGHGYDNLVSGNAFTQTTAVDETIASSEGTANHYTDYAWPEDSYPDLLADKSELPLGDEHPNNSIADYMKTSQSYFNNYYGWSWFSDIGSAMTAYANSGFLADNNYAITRNLYMGSTLNWNSFRAEIDAGRPMVLLVDSDADGWTDHFVTAIGYDTIGNVPYYACWDTWYDDTIRWSQFAPMASGQSFGIYGGVTFRIGKGTFLPIIVK